MAWFNFHTHTNYCDGTEAPEKYLFEALDLNMAGLGFSGHAPLALKNEWCIPSEKLNDYSLHINKLKREYEGQINIFLGLEIDYIPGITVDFSKLRDEQNLDYIIGSVHLVKKDDNPECWFIDGAEGLYDKGIKSIFLQNVQDAVCSYFRQSAEMVETQNPDIIGHLDKVKMYNRNRFFKEDDQWYRDAVMELLEVIKQKGTIVEVNARGLYKHSSNSTYPDPWIIKECRKMNIPLTISSDAHKPAELVLNFFEAAAIMKDAGVKDIMMLVNGSWQPVGFSKKGIIR